MNKKALSPVVASIILIAIVVAVAVAVAAWTGTLSFSFRNRGSKQPAFYTDNTFEYQYTANFTITVEPGNYTPIYDLQNFCNNTAQVESAIGTWVSNETVSHNLTNYKCVARSVADLIHVGVKTIPASEIQMYLYHDTANPNSAELYKLIQGADRFTFTWLTAFGFANLSNKNITVLVTVSGVGDAIYMLTGEQR
jgi:flagellin-like protein